MIEAKQSSAMRVVEWTEEGSFPPLVSSHSYEVDYTFLSTVPVNFFAMIEDVVFRQSTVAAAAIWAFEKHFLVVNVVGAIN